MILIKLMNNCILNAHHALPIKFTNNSFVLVILLHIAYSNKLLGVHTIHRDIKKPEVREEIDKILHKV